MVNSQEAADDPATRALIELVEPYDCTGTVDEEDNVDRLTGPAGTCKFSLSVHEDNELGFVVGESEIWVGLYIGDASTAERSEIAGDIVSAVLRGRIAEDMWGRDGTVVASQATFRDSGREYHKQDRFGGFGAPDERITYPAYPLRCTAPR